MHVRAAAECRVVATPPPGPLWRRPHLVAQHGGGGDTAAAPRGSARGRTGRAAARAVAQLCIAGGDAAATRATGFEILRAAAAACGRGRGHLAAGNRRGRDLARARVSRCAQAVRRGAALQQLVAAHEALYAHRAAAEVERAAPPTLAPAPAISAPPLRAV